MNTKRNYFFDYLRVLSVLLVITSHYAYMFDVSDVLFFPRKYLTGGIGRIGVSFFFMISGGMAYLSLEKYTSRDYYIRRAVSILIPYNVVYFIMAVMLLILGAVWNVEYPRNVFGMLFGGERILWDLVPTFLGFDHYLHGVYGIDTMYFTGEWFIGCIIILYFLAPVFFNFLNRSPLLALAFAISISLVTYDSSSLNPYWSAPVRLGDFVFGMFFIKHYDYFEKNKLRLAVGAGLCMLMGSIYALWAWIDLREVLFPLSPQSLIFAVSMFILLFCGYRYGTFLEKPKLLRGIRALAGRSYIIMLLQHVVIIALSSNVDMSKLSGIQSFMYYIAVLIFCERFSVIAKIGASWCERKILKPSH